MYQMVRSAEKHLTLATEARSYMKGQVAQAKGEIVRAFDTIPPLGARGSVARLYHARQVVLSNSIFYVNSYFLYRSTTSSTKG